MLKSRLIYLGIILTSFIFSQALYESVSFMTFVIVLILPIISIFFALVVYPFISVRIITNGSNVRRLDEFVIRVVIKGVCPFISPAMKITCSVPDENGYEIKKTIFAASPSFLIKSYFDYTCKLVNRGTYTLKVDSIEYYDFLKLVKIKKKFKKSLKVNVQPRKIKVDIPVAYEQYNQDNTYILGENTNASVGDMVGVRDYVMGDNLKNVHWKLSSKSEELITKTYAEDICDKAYIIVDMSAYYEEHFINKSMTDCVVELALCAVEEYAKTSVRFGVVLSPGLNEPLLLQVGHGCCHGEAGVLQQAFKHRANDIGLIAFQRTQHINILRTAAEPVGVLGDPVADVFIGTITGRNGRL